MTYSGSNAPIAVSNSGSDADPEWSPDLDPEDLLELEAAEHDPSKIISRMPRESVRLGYFSTICLISNRMIGKSPTQGKEKDTLLTRSWDRNWNLQFSVRHIHQYSKHRNIASPMGFWGNHCPGRCHYVHGIRLDNPTLAIRSKWRENIHSAKWGQSELCMHPSELLLCLLVGTNLMHYSSTTF